MRIIRNTALFRLFLSVMDKFSNCFFRIQNDFPATRNVKNAIILGSTTIAIYSGCCCCRCPKFPLSCHGLEDGLKGMPLFRFGAIYIAQCHMLQYILSELASLELSLMEAAFWLCEVIYLGCIS